MALLAVADVYAGEQCCRQGGNLVIETIMARRSVRMYKDMPVERCKLQKIVECGINAPSGMNKQPWQVRVVDSREYIDGITGVFRKANPRMADDASFKNMFRNAPAVIFIASPADGSGQILLYRSKNGFEWEFVSTLAENKNRYGKMWELSLIHI